MLATVLCAAVAAQGPLHEERKESRRLQFSGQGVRTLDVRAMNGTIRVTGDGGADVRLEATMAFDAETQEALGAAQRDVTIEGREEGATVAIAVRDRRRPDVRGAGQLAAARLVGPAPLRRLGHAGDPGTA